ncbi:Hypothetical predicted protein [Marmota monax]|uniref:Uncharacterized protein n=1 Tax=Marmota monax TaxID=9995 RepID=A0A5E4CFG5_MARMO|nr:Hypothetical predicted protein [Marmota monax]
MKPPCLLSTIARTDQRDECTRAQGLAGKRKLRRKEHASSLSSPSRKAPSPSPLRDRKSVLQPSLNCTELPPPSRPRRAGDNFNYFLPEVKLGVGGGARGGFNRQARNNERPGEKLGPLVSECRRFDLGWSNSTLLVGSFFSAEEVKKLNWKAGY